MIPVLDIILVRKIVHGSHITNHMIPVFTIAEFAIQVER